MMVSRLILSAFLSSVGVTASTMAENEGAVSVAVTEGPYAIVVSKRTMADAGWSQVVQALVTRHPQAKIIIYDGKLNEALPALVAKQPRYTAFVVTSAESSREFVAEVSRLTRHFNADPYTDTCWGIVTGLDADNALEMAKFPGLTVNNVSGNTAFETRCVKSGLWYDELEAGLQVETKADGAVERRQGAQDSTAGIVAGIQNCDLLITSSHGTERSWQLGHVYRNGFILSKGGELIGKDTKGNLLAIAGGHEKAWMPVGNCLVGHIDGPDAFALAMFKDGKVRAAAAYTVPTWYGYAGWGILDYFVEQPGRYTYAQAVWANRLALEHRLYGAWPKAADISFSEQVRLGTPTTGSLSDQDGAGLLHDRDVLAFYGDPAAQVVMPKKWRAYEQELVGVVDEAGVTQWTLTITGNAGADSFTTVNTNGSQRGGRPIVQFLPRAIDPASVKIISAGDLKPMIGSDWILVPRPAGYVVGQTLKVTFTATDAAVIRKTAD